MSASNEWNEYHLTPRGWEPGSFKTDFAGIKERPTPPDRAMTCTSHEYQSGIYSKVDRWTDEDWRSADAALVARLLVQFGPCPS
ncbi:MAG: hypothetical protein QM778_33315 [Myxococcales bacterium]